MLFLLYPTMGSVKLGIAYYPTEFKKLTHSYTLSRDSFGQKLINSMPEIYEHSSLKVTT